MSLENVWANWALTGLIVGGFVLVTQFYTGSPSNEPADENTADGSEFFPPVTMPENETTVPEPEPDVSTSGFPQTLSVCPSMTITNRPGSLNGLEIANYQPFVSIDGVEIATAPVADGCFSSGFGPRGERLHKGIDIHNSVAVEIYAAADGVIREKLYRDDYGNMIVIDHGNNVYTRYAHLESFASGLDVDGAVTAGTTLGMMGNTAGYSIPRHLHYEVLTGEWGEQAGSFSLTALNIFARLPDN